MGTLSTEQLMASFIEWWDMTPGERKGAGLALTLERWAKANETPLIAVTEWDAHLRVTRTRTNDEFRDFLALMKTVAYRDDASQQDRMNYMRMQGWLTEKKEEHDKFELTHTDRLKVAGELIVGIRESYKRDGGVCPVCGKSSLLPNEVCVDTEQEHR